GRARFGRRAEAPERPYAWRIEWMLDALSGHNRPSSANARGAPPPRSALDRPSNHATWSVALGFSRNVQFHAVRSGRCWIRVNDGAAVELRDDDFAVLPHGDPHEVINDPRTPAVPAAELLADFAGQSLAPSDPTARALFPH